MSKFVSYAQNHEDVILWRAFKNIEQGFYIDVGANDPDIDSVTKAFYERGWHGINIEPVPQWHARLMEARPRDLNWAVAAGAKKSSLTLYELPDTGLSTSSLEIAKRHEGERGYTKQEITVPLETLDSICEAHAVGDIHFLKIDVEGAEKQVLLGLDLKIRRPWILVVESTLPNTQLEDYEEWEELITAHDYRFVYFDGLNRYYLSAEHQELELCFRAPPNVFDDFVTANHWQAEQLVETYKEKCRAVSVELQVSQEQLAASERRSLMFELEKEKHFNATLEAELRFQHALNEQASQRLRFQDLERELSRIQAELHESLQNAHHWWVTASGYQEKLEAVLQSTTWRLTEPLRVIVEAAHGSTSLKNALKRTLRPTFIWAMRQVLYHPVAGRARMPAQRLLSRYPRLRDKLRSVAINAKLIGSSAPETVPVLQAAGETLEFEHLPPKAREIYRVLKKANMQEVS